MVVGTEKDSVFSCKCEDEVPLLKVVCVVCLVCVVFMFVFSLDRQVSFEDFDPLSSGVCARIAADYFPSVL